MPSSANLSASRTKSCSAVCGSCGQGALSYVQRTNERTSERAIENENGDECSYSSAASGGSATTTQQTIFISCAGSLIVRILSHRPATRFTFVVAVFFSSVFVVSVVHKVGKVAHRPKIKIVRLVLLVLVLVFCPVDFYVRRRLSRCSQQARPVWAGLLFGDLEDDMSCSHRNLAVV